MQPVFPTFCDEATGTRLLPFAHFKDFAPYASKSKLPRDLQHLPVLATAVDPKKVKFLQGLPMHLGYGVVHVGGSLALTFRLQCGPDLIFVLANPFDAKLWEALDAWDAAGSMVLAIDLPGQAVVASRDYRFNSHLETIRQVALSGPTQRPLAFGADVAKTMLGNSARHLTTSDLGAFPTFRNVETRMLITDATGPVALVDDGSAMRETGATLH